MNSNQVHAWGGDPLVYAVVLNWNCWPDTMQCVACLQRSRYANLTVLVVENGSEDGSAQRIRGVCPGVEILETGANLGYAGGNNAGIVRALEEGADYVLVVNPDVELQPDTLARLIERAAARPNVGALSPAVVYTSDPQTVWYGGGRIDWQEGVAHHEHMLEPVSALNDSDFLPTDYASGCCLLLSSRTLTEVGLFDERYFLYWEEVDLCQRMRAAGYQVGVCTDARALHQPSSMVGEASVRQQYYKTRGALRFFALHARRRQRLRILYRLSRRALLNRSALHAMLRRDPGALARARAVADSMLRRFGASPVYSPGAHAPLEGAAS